jgi:hypothetical protein
LAQRLPLYDANLREYESRLARRRKEFAGFKLGLTQLRQTRR